jgi:hypothetical protein
MIQPPVAFFPVAVASTDTVKKALNSIVALQYALAIVLISMLW